MSNEARERALSPASDSAGKASGSTEKKHEKRTITEIRESKRTGEKMVYMSVPDYTSAKWAEMGGVDVAVVGDSLAMVAHGHASTIPASMDMMVMHALAVRRGAPNTFVLGCMPYQSYNTVDRALVNATRFMLEFEAVPAKIAEIISKQLTIPTIGIGAGVGTDGQILLCYDLLGVFTDFKPKFTKRYTNLTEVAVNGLRQYVEEVK